MQHFIQTIILLRFCCKVELSKVAVWLQKLSLTSGLKYLQILSWKYFVLTVWSLRSFCNFYQLKSAISSTNKSTSGMFLFCLFVFSSSPKLKSLVCNFDTFVLLCDKIYTQIWFLFGGVQILVENLNLSMSEVWFFSCLEIWSHWCSSCDFRGLKYLMFL